MTTMRVFSLGLITCALIGCRTDFHSFKENISLGVTADQVRTYLEENKIRYKFSTCEELEEQLSEPKLKCINPKSNRVYVGFVKDGSYLIGIGSGDVRFLVEIGTAGDVVEIQFDKINTFL